MAPEVRQRGKASPRSDVYSLAVSLLHLVTGLPWRREPCWPADLPEGVRAVIAAGMEPDPEWRPDLPRFLGMLREARWRRLAEDVLGRQPGEAAPVRLRAAVAVAPAGAPTTFTALSPVELPRRLLRTGDLVRIESVASADGHQTILLLSAGSGDVKVVLPRPNAEGNFFAAEQPHRLLLRLAPPAGRERVLVVWSREDVRRSASEWQGWLERRRDEGLSLPAPRQPRNGVRSLEVLGSRPGQPPRGSWRALVLSLGHASPGLAGARGAGQDHPAG
jgi:hypothetical protein